jgi:hypothetical protein
MRLPASNYLSQFSEDGSCFARILEEQRTQLRKISLSSSPGKDGFSSPEAKHDRKMARRPE